MASIEHPMTTHHNQKELDVKPQVMKEAVVMSPEDEALVRKQMAEFEATVQEAAPVEQVKDPVIEEEVSRKRALEDLVLFSRPQLKKIKINNTVFSLKLLTARDSDEVYEEVLKLPSADQVTKASRMLLAASILEMDGVPLERFYTGPQEVDKTLLRKYYTISGWPVALTNSLNRAYKKMVADAEESFDFDFLEE